MPLAPMVFSGCNAPEGLHCASLHCSQVVSDLSRDTNGEANNRCHLYFEPSCRQGYIWSAKTVLPNLHQNLCPFYLTLALHHENEEGPLEFSVTLADPCLCHIP